jgi:hypothetical protein
VSKDICTSWQKESEMGMLPKFPPTYSEDLVQTNIDRPYG